MAADYRQTASWLRERLPLVPQAGVILGTGLNDLADHLEILFKMPYSEIPGFASSTAPSHKGNLILGKLGGVPILCLQGRFHFYEGYPMSTVVFPVRVMACLGVGTLIVTNASGSLREQYAPGSIIQLNDHINHMGTNPLIGHNDETLGERFPSLNDVYDREYLEICRQIAAELKINLPQGTYIAVTGPSLETKAECAAFAGWGADLVGMSTVPEVIAARHAGMRVLALSVVTNYSNLFHDLEHSQEEIRQNANLAAENLRSLLAGFLRKLAKA